MNELKKTIALDQRKAIARELIFAIATALVAFKFLPGDYLPDVVAGLVALVVLVWGVVDKTNSVAAYGSLVRKLAVAAGGIAVRLEYVTDQQLATLLSILTAVIATSFGRRASEKNSIEKAMKL